MVKIKSVPYPIFIISIFMIIALAACNDADGPSPFGNILSEPPYSSLTDSIKKQPKNDELYFRRAVLLNKNNLPEPALADFQKAWSLSKHEKYAYGIANVWVDKKPDSAVIFLNGALQELPKSYLLRITLARAYDKLNKTDEAIKVCEEVLQIAPDLANIWLFKSELLEKKGDRKNAVAALEKAYELVPNFDIASKLAYQYAENKDARAIALSDALIQKDTLQLFTEQPYYIKGIYYSNINDKTKALHFFDETIRRNHNYMSAYTEKGKILVAQKKHAEALKVFRLANTIRPSYPDAYFWIGVCQEALGQKEDAKLNYEKAYGLDKTFTEAKEAADKLK